MFRIKHYPPERHYGIGNNLCERCPNRAHDFTWEFGDDLNRQAVGLRQPAQTRRTSKLPLHLIRRWRWQDERRYAAHLFIM